MHLHCAQVPPPPQAEARNTSFAANVCSNLSPAGTLSYQTLFAVGAVLFSMTLVLNLIANSIMNRYRDVYE